MAFRPRTARVRAVLLGSAGRNASQVHTSFKSSDLVPRLAAIIPKLEQSKKANLQPLDWTASTDDFFRRWHKVKPCMSLYNKHVDERDVGNHVASQRHLGQFYLCCAKQFMPAEFEKAGSNNAALKSVAQACAEQEIGPMMDDARKLISDYCPKLHKALEDTCPIYDVDEGLFWQASFDIVAPAEFQLYLTWLGGAGGRGAEVGRQQLVPGLSYTGPEEVELLAVEAQKTLESNAGAADMSRRVASEIWCKWLRAASMPTKAGIIKTLAEHALIAEQELHTNARKGVRSLQEIFSVRCPQLAC